MDFEFVHIDRHIYRKWVFLVDFKCQNTVILTGLTYTLSRKVFLIKNQQWSKIIDCGLIIGRKENG